MNNLILFFDLRKFSRKQKIHFLINIIVGIIIVSIFTLSEHTDRGESLHNSAFDILIKNEAKNFSNLQPKDEEIFIKNSPLYFMDISHENYKILQRPLITPRDKIAEMLNRARRNGAKFVIIDLLLEYEDCYNNGQVRDNKLRTEMEKMLRENSSTKVIFPVSMNYDGEINKNLYDDLIRKRTPGGNKIFYHATPTISATAADRLNRFWSIYKIGKGEGKIKIVWGMPFLAAVLAADKEEELDYITQQIIGNINLNEVSYKIELGEKKAKYQFIAKLFGISNQIRIPPALMHIEKSLLDGKEMPVYEIKESETEIYTQRIRYHLIPPGISDLPSNITQIRRDYDKVAISHDDLNGKIVIIGNSSPDAGDMHQTPIGTMPGMYIIGNAVNTIMSGMQPVYMSAILHFILELMVIILAAYLFLHLHSLIAEIITSFIILIIFFPLSWWIFKTWGLFFNFLIPVSGMALHKTVSSIEDVIIHRGKKH